MKEILFSLLASLSLLANLGADQRGNFVPFENSDFKATIPAGFLFKDLKESGAVDIVRGYFYSPDDSVRFYYQWSLQVSLFFNAKSEGVGKAEFRVLNEDRGGLGVSARTELVVCPVDKTRGDYRRYLTIETSTETAGGARQFGIQVARGQSRKKWEPVFQKFRESLEFKHEY